MASGVKNFALTSVVVANCVIIGKVAFFSSDWDKYNGSNDTFNEEYFEKSLCKNCNDTWSANFIRNASQYTKFYYFSRFDRTKRQNFSEIMSGNMSSLRDSGFDANKTTKLLIHGWLDNAFINFATEVREAYLETQDVNVVAVDWSPVAGHFYPLARVAVGSVGRFLAQFLDWLVSTAGVSVGSVHIVGHSLGAHVAGVAGELVTVGKIGRITGLDPAGPGFDPTKRDRLDASDAEFVDVIHTAGMWAGFFDTCGHADFYPNRGVPNQPGCPLDFGKCSHIRAYKLFSESISNTNFVSRACGSWKDFNQGLCKNNATAVMGEHVDSRCTEPHSSVKIAFCSVL